LVFIVLSSLEDVSSKVHAAGNRIAAAVIVLPPVILRINDARA